MTMASVEDRRRGFQGGYLRVYRKYFASLRLTQPGGNKCVVLIPEGKIAFGKLSQAVMHGAQVLSVLSRKFDVALKLVES